MTIFLTGYMASGKTTLGRALARATGRPFYDLDFYIEQRFRRKVSEIFAERGEGEFRRMESEMLREIGELDDVIISCGGGTPCHNDNMAYMNERGMTLWLDAPVDVIVRRLLVAKTKRPITARYSREELPDFVAKHLSERMPYYSQARLRVDASDLESREAIDNSVRQLYPYLSLSFKTTCGGSI
ncbi:MAG: shikimate kinase [Muribaculaceae bacterium]|nr:shikimate kinase [Muribaculaceae bacterium]